MDKYKEIPLETIDTEGQTVREAQDDDHVIELSMNILKNGLLQPIVVRTKEDGRYQLDAGFHRLAAFVRLQKKTIPAHIREQPAASTKATALIENILRKSMTIREECSAVGHLNSSEGLSPSQICDLLGKTRAWVDQRLTIPNFPDELKEEVLDGRIPIRTAEVISTLEDEPSRKFIINQVINCKLTTHQVRELVSVFKNAPSIQMAIDAGLQKQEEIQKSPHATRRCEACGTLRRLEELKFVPVCMYGCPQDIPVKIEIDGKEVPRDGG